jgi:hypothetical protein
VTDVDDLLARLGAGWRRSMPADDRCPIGRAGPPHATSGATVGRSPCWPPLVVHALPIALGKDALPLVPFVESSARTPA